MKKDKKSLAAFVGASIVTSLSAGVVNAAENPFVLKDMAQGYMQVAEVVPFSGQAAAPAAKPAEAAKPAAEMKCGAEMMKGNPEMKCGASMMKGMFHWTWGCLKQKIKVMLGCKGTEKC